MQHEITHFKFNGKSVFCFFLDGSEKLSILLLLRLLHTGSAGYFLETVIIKFRPVL